MDVDSFISLSLSLLLVVSLLEQPRELWNPEFGAFRWEEYCSVYLLAPLMCGCDVSFRVTDKVEFGETNTCRRCIVVIAA